MNRKSSLSAYVAKTVEAVQPSAPKTPSSGGDTKKQTVRLTKDQWVRLSHLSVEQERSFQDLCIEGLSKLFTERGLPPL